jgi:eukaryotic-like serine/threonine-protein kinase
MTPTFAHDRFEIVRILGRGGMGVVYLARDRQLDRLVALKVVEGAELDGEARRRLQSEARAVASIRHPNVATVYEVGQTADGLPFIAMEYCEGPTLAQVSREVVKSDRLLAIARQIASGLAAAHQAGLLHGDIKSANMILQPDGGIKILDFGLARRFGHRSSQHETTRMSAGAGFVGTLAYSSPEQLTAGTVDHRSDLFSVGVVLYELSSGRLPFDHISPLLMMEQIRDAEPAPFEPRDQTLPDEFAQILGRLLQKDPADRIQSSVALVEALAAVPETPSERKVSRRSGNLGRTSRQRHSSLLAVLAAVLAIVIVSLTMIDRRDETITAAEPLSPIRSLAVLPFETISSTEDDDFLSVGLADALATRLQQMPELLVRPTSSTLGFRQKLVSAQKAGRQLEVDAVLEGRIIAAGSALRVNLQLTDSRSGYGIWAESVDGQRDDLLQLMDQISSRAAVALSRRLALEQKGARSLPRSADPQAYELYLKARALTGSLLPAESRQQIELLQKAVAIDGDFAAAHADLAIALSLRRARGFVDEAADAEWHARQAVRLDPNLPEAHQALGRTLAPDPERYRESVRESLAALRLNPHDPNALYSMVSYFVASGEIDKARCVGDVFVSIDPSSNDARTRGYWNVNAVDPEGSLAISSLALAVRETELAGYDIRALSHLALGNLAAARADQRRASELVPDHYIGKSLAALIAAAAGDRSTVELELGRMHHDLERNHWAALRAALAYARLGDRAAAIEWTRRAAALGNQSWFFLVRHPWMAPLQSEPEFQQIVTRIKGNLDDVRDDILGVYSLICADPPSQRR